MALKIVLNGVLMPEFFQVFCVDFGEAVGLEILLKLANPGSC